MDSTQKIGFIGAGLMGYGMAKCFIARGNRVVVLRHKNSVPIRKLEKMGANVTANKCKLAESIDILVTCLPNAEIVEKVAIEIVPLLKKEMIWIDTTTSKPETSEMIGNNLRNKGVIFADAPVTGGPAQALEGQLASLIGCDRTQYNRIESIVRTYSKVVRHFGEFGSGNTAKLLNNLVSQGMAILLADAFLSAELSGIDRQALYDVMVTGAVRSGTLEKMIKPYLAGNYEGSQFSIANSYKDICYGRELIGELLPGHVDLYNSLAERQKKQLNAGRGNNFVSNLLKHEFIVE